MAEPYYITYANKEIDDMVVKHVSRVEQLVDFDRPESRDNVFRFIAEHEIRIVNLHVATTAKCQAGYYIPLLERLRANGVRIVMTLHDVLPFATFEVDMDAVRKLQSLADVYLVGNETQRALLYENFDVGDRAVRITPHPPYLLFNQRRFDRASARELLDLPEDDRIILFFGRLRPDKGLDELLRCLPRVRERVADATLLISTDTSYTPQWNARFDDLIARGHGDGLYVRREYVESDMIEPIFVAADVVAMPYENVSQSGVHNLAKAFERPVVVTEAFDCADAIDGVSGRSIPVGDEDALVEALVDILSRSDEERHHLGLAALSEALEHESWQGNVRAILEAGA